MGLPKKPVDQLQFTRGGRAERRTFPVSVPRVALVAPPPPAGLKAAGRAVWEAYWTDPVSLAATRVDGYDIARYCRLHDEREAVEKRIAGRSQYGGDVIEGMNGPILNPLHRVRKELTREIEKLREMLGILPLARMRLGLVQTQRDIGVADLRRRLDRAGEATDAIEAEATEVVELDGLG
jgi:P27 family predicted phage terminase small subunit